MTDRKKLGEIMVELGILSPDELDRILYALRQRRQHAKFGQVAKAMGLVCEEHILAALAVQMRLFPRVHELSLAKILGRLRQPNITPVQFSPLTSPRHTP